jgi:MtrB/PioB family decaheme-associated outer membrane protein
VDPFVANRRNGSLRTHVLLGTTLAAFAAASQAHADSAVGTSIPLGTQLNPTGSRFILPNNPMGLSLVFQNSRTPTGLLYPRPYLYPPMVQSQSNPDWWSSGWAEIGYLGTSGNTGAATFREYGDLSAGPIINSAGFLAENRRTAFFMSANVGSVGRADQTYQLTLGKYGVFTGTLFYDSIPHIFSTNAKILWDGAGTGRLTLPPTLTPGASTPSQVQSVLAALFPGEVSLTREKAGMALTYTPGELSEVFFRFGYEEREGTRPLGATFGYPFQNGVTELVEPIEYRTFEVNAGARFKGETLQANLTYAGSFFRNDIPALVWDNPGLTSLAPGAYIPTQGQMALPPDNDYHTVKGDLAWAFDKGRFAASASYASMKQNSSLLPPTIGTGVINGVTGAIDLANWNTVGSLSRDTALAEIATFNGFAQFQYNVTSQLRFDLEARFRNEDNKTNYVAFNPLTGQYGYIAIDGGLSSLFPFLSGVYEPTVAGQRVQIRNIPFATDTLTLTAKGSYRFANRDRIELAYANKSVDYSNREVGDATDHRFSAQFVTRARSYGTTRIAYEYATLSGDTYNSYPYGPYNSTSLAGYIPRYPTGDAPFTLGPLRKYDIADRTEQALRSQTNFILSDRVDLQLGANFRLYDYDADYGLKSARNLNLNAELTYQVSLATNFNLFYSFQAHKREAANINPEEGSPDDSAGSPTYPLANEWSEEAKDKNHVFGAGIRHTISSVTIDLNYTFTYGDSAFGYSYATPGAFFSSLTPEEAGTAFPDNTFRHHLVETSVLWKYTEKLGVRGYYRLEHEEIDDFHYTGLTQVIDNNIYLAAVPDSYTAHVFGVFFQYSY